MTRGNINDTRNYAGGRERSGHCEWDRPETFLSSEPQLLLAINLQEQEMIKLNNDQCNNNKKCGKLTSQVLSLNP